MRRILTCPTVCTLYSIHNILIQLNINIHKVNIPVVGGGGNMVEVAGLSAAGNVERVFEWG